MMTTSWMEGIISTGSVADGNSCHGSTTPWQKVNAVLRGLELVFVEKNKEKKEYDKKETRNMEASKFEQQSGGRLVSKWIRGPRK